MIGGPEVGVGGASSFRISRAELQRRLETGERYSEIGRAYGVSRVVVRRRAHAFDLVAELRAPRPDAPPPSEAGLRMALAHADIPLNRIAAAFGVHPNIVKRAAKSYGLPIDPAGRAALAKGRG